MRRIVAATLLPCALAIDAGAQRVSLAIDDQCASLTTAQLADRAQLATERTSVTSQLSMWPGGDVVTVQIPRALATPSAFCVRLRQGDLPVPVVSELLGIGAQAGTTTLTLALPEIRFGVQQAKELVLVGFPLDSGRLRLDAPSLAVVQRVRLSNGTFASLGAVVAVVAAYLVAVLALGRVGKSHSLNAACITADKFGRASLSQLQIFGFTLLVLGLLVYVLLRTGVLSDISKDILLLLGISAVGTAGSQVTAVMRRRLSFDNWSWLRNQGWLVAYEDGTGQAPDASRARWSDLLKMGDTFDVYSFQLATVSLLVGGALISGVRDVATFSIPGNLLALLGLSNVVYIGGKTVDPNSFGELDEKVKAVRDAERTWLSGAAAQIAGAANAAAKLAAAEAAGPAHYQAYLAAAREAARMLKSLYGAEGTKFKKEPIVDTELDPAFFTKAP